MRRTRITLEVDWLPGENVAEPNEWQWELLLPDVFETPHEDNPIRNVRVLETTDITPGGEVLGYGGIDQAPFVPAHTPGENYE